MKNKNMTSIVLIVLFASLILFSFKEIKSNCGKPPEKEVISKTEHCSYSKVWITDGITKTFIYVCECDPGYECKIQIP